jgi:hypothetical protein
MSRRIKFDAPTASIKRLFEEFMKTDPEIAKGSVSYEQLTREPCLDDYNEDGDYAPRPLLDHLCAVAHFIGGDLEDRFLECIEEIKTTTTVFQPEGWRQGEEEEGAAKQAAE